MSSILNYYPPFLHRSAHLSTILPNRFRKIKDLKYTRKTIELPDGDFVDIDTSLVGSRTAVLLLHGLEGSSDSQYMRGLSQLLNQMGIDAWAMNHRSCSGKTNRLAIGYHSGKTDDADFIINTQLKDYKNLFVVGFSLGGNIAIKLAGEWRSRFPKNVKGVVGVSVPCDLGSSAVQLKAFENVIYLTRFLRQLKRKAKEKTARFPELNLDAKAVAKAKNFEEFDHHFTAPVHGFASAKDYYEKSSCAQYIPLIQVPSMIINAANDSFLGMECYPIEELNRNSKVELLTPEFGGHVGFAMDMRMKQPFWHEERIAEFIRKIVSTTK